MVIDKYGIRLSLPSTLDPHYVRDLGVRRCARSRASHTHMMRSGSEFHVSCSYRGLPVNDVRVR